MRLLRVDNVNEAPRESYGEPPPYAILSHTWHEDNDQEVSFRNLVDRSGHDKLGWSKVQFCAQQAARDGLEYIWVDTCCIDKTNNTELTEAINSMFEYYRSSARCYVYLADVEYSIDRTIFHNGNAEISRWFTRGWTLQELIAPPSVEFYDSKGQHIGNKQSLSRELTTATGLPEHLMLLAPLSNYSIEERFSWAKDRRTKRPEDIAYCLLGIFDVRMRPDYGEGAQNAELRLRNKIYKKFSPLARLNNELKAKIELTLAFVNLLTWGGGVYVLRILTMVRRVVHPRPTFFAPIVSQAIEPLALAAIHCVVALLSTLGHMVFLEYFLSEDQIEAQGLFAVICTMSLPLIIIMNLLSPVARKDFFNSLNFRDLGVFLGSSVMAVIPAVTGGWLFSLQDNFWRLVFQYFFWPQLHCHVSNYYRISPEADECIQCPRN